jgi:CRISPR-associated endonuclease/helicase Cas3
LGPDKRPDRSTALHDLLTPLVSEGGCAAVVGNTVAEAQLTYLQLKSWLLTWGGEVPVIRLLHSRFPAWRREEITEEVVHWFGKNAGDDRPGAAILVATQVIEQSLDLDFDLVVSDLAPMAMLLQRAGRCQRHPSLDPRRPEWAMEEISEIRQERMRLVVLTPADASGALIVPRSWPYVYPAALLRRTRNALATLPDAQVAIPDAIQGLVDQVYDTTFGDETSAFTEEDAARIADEQVKALYADMAAIPAPRRVSQLSDLTGDDFVDEYSTRLGADSGKVVCCTVGADGRLLLAGMPLPVEPLGRKGTRTWFTKAQVRLILENAIPVPGTWLRGRSDLNSPPAAWADSAHLRDLAVIELSSQDLSGRLGDRHVQLTSDLGLSEVLNG